MALDSALASRQHAFAAQAHEVRGASEWLERNGGELGLPREQVQRLDLCLNEALANILAHGGEEALAVPVELELMGVGSQGSAVLLIRDGGCAFDPTQSQPRQRPARLEDAQPGGLGLIMMQSNSDAMHYRRVADRNELQFTVQWQAES